MTDKLYWYWFCSMLGINSRRQHQLIEIFLHPRELFAASPNIIEETLSKKAYQRFMETRSPDQIRRSYEALEKAQIRFLVSGEAAYPAKLKEIYDYPYGMFQKGQAWQMKPLVIAIVGSRHPSSYGLEIARLFAKELSDLGVGIVSGLAKGIDGAAHRGAGYHRGATAGVLGCGIDQIYPWDNHQLFYEMYETQTVFSEYPPGTRPDPWRFPERNRIISGLSDGILVVEAEQKSSSLITADCGLEQNKEVFAVPGPVTSGNHAGCHGLIKQGAKLVETTEDILSEFPNFTKSSKSIRRFQKKSLAHPEKKVYDVVDLYPRHLNEIMNAAGLSLGETAAALFSLESDGYIKQIHHNIYIKNIYKG